MYKKNIPGTLILATYFKVIKINQRYPLSCIIIVGSLRKSNLFSPHFSFGLLLPLFKSVCICVSIFVVDSLNVLLCKDGNFPNLLLPRYTGKVFLGNPRQPSQINFLPASIKHYHHKNELAKRRYISDLYSRTELTILESIKTYFSSACILVSTSFRMEHVKCLFLFFA